MDGRGSTGHSFGGCSDLYCCLLYRLGGRLLRPQARPGDQFRKILDPLADKLLVTAAFVALVQLGYAPAWMVIIILSREFAVTGIRLVAAAEGAVIAASQMGKLKTWIQIIAISALLLHNIPFAWIGIPFAQISMWAATLITLYSGWEYFIQNKEVMLKSK